VTIVYRECDTVCSIRWGICVINVDWLPNKPSYLIGWLVYA
jgi:hypothetical protein